MKRKIAIVLTVLLSLLHFGAYAADISVYVDDILVQLTDVTGKNVYPFIQNGTTYVPLRGISETLGCDVIWDGANRTILVYKEIQADNSVFRNDSEEIKIYVDNQPVELKDANGTVVKPFIKEGTTYIPLRGISQALGGWVRWNGQTMTVSVYMEVIPPDGVTLTEYKPYDGYKYWGHYENEGQYLNIVDSDYTNALAIDEGEALFNLNGKFNSVTMTVGSYGYFGDDKEIVFIVDGKIVKTQEIPANSTEKEIKIPLNKGLQLKIKVNGLRAGMGNITFWGE